MPIVFKGKHLCEECKKHFEWVYFELEKSKLSSGVFMVEKIPNKPKAYRIETINNKHRIFVNCPHCGYDNRFIYETECNQ